MRLKDWLDISTEGFSQRQADRPPAHLLKELIQNALDATAGEVDVRIEPEKLGRKTHVKLTVTDNGPGILNIEDVRTVFCTSKTDSFLLRGRLGQGMKEILCLCQEAIVSSRAIQARFFIEKGKRVCDVAKVSGFPGTSVTMWIPWKPDVIPELERYLHTFVVPADVTMKINERTAAGSKLPVAYAVDVTLKTELFEKSRWVRRERPGVVHLIAPSFPSDTMKIYEMGIPVQELDWTQPYHINVQMRVPMNPRRDAVAAGYLKDLYCQILPVLMPKIKPEDLRDEWVSLAIENADPNTRKNVVAAAFGANAVRSVPTFGQHDFDSDARERGLRPIDTSLLPKGLRDATRETLVTSRDAEMTRRDEILTAPRVVYTTDQFEAVRRFVGWLAGELVGMSVCVDMVEKLGTDLSPAVATRGMPAG